MLFEALVGCFFIAIRDVVPELAADEHGKEATRIGRTSDAGVLGGGEKGEPLAVTLANQSLCLDLLEEHQESVCRAEIVRHNVTQCRRLQGEGFRICLSLFFNTRRGSAGGGSCVLEGWSRLGGGRLQSGFLVFKVLER